MVWWDVESARSLCLVLLPTLCSAEMQSTPHVSLDAVEMLLGGALEGEGLRVAEIGRFAAIRRILQRRWQRDEAEAESAALARRALSVQAVELRPFVNASRLRIGSIGIKRSKLDVWS